MIENKIQIPPKISSNGVLNYYRRKSLPSNFNERGYLKASSSSRESSDVLEKHLGTGDKKDENHFATSSEYGSWVQIKMKYPVFITHYLVYQCHGYPYDNRFRKWEVDGSNDGITWFALDNYSVNENTTMQETEVSYLFTVQNPGKYEFIKIIMYKTAREKGNIYHLVFSNFDIFGTIYSETCLTARRRILCNKPLLVFIFIHTKQ